MKRNFKRGVSLYFTVIIMSVLLALSLGLSIILFSQTKVTREIGYSTIAFYAADTGIEYFLDTFREDCEKNYDNQPDCENNGCFWDGDSCEYNPCPSSSPCFLILNGEEKYYFNVTTSSEGCSQPYCVKSYGVYKDIKRAIQITF